jgi:hypothetical protein
VVRPVPADLHVVLAKRAADGRPRRAVAAGVLAVALHQAAHVAAMVAAFALEDYALLARSVDDRIAEPVGPVCPGFAEAAAALEAGAGELDWKRTHGLALARDARARASGGRWRRPSRPGREPPCVGPWTGTAQQ